MRKFGAPNDNSTGEPHSILGAENIRSFSLKILFFWKSGTQEGIGTFEGQYFFIPLQIQILT